MQVIYPEKFQKRFEEAKAYWEQAFQSQLEELNKQQKQMIQLQKQKKVLWKINVASIIVMLIGWAIYVVYEILNRINMGNSTTIRDISIDSKINLIPVLLSASLTLSAITLVIFIIWLVWFIRERTDRTIYEYYIDVTLDRCANHMMKPYKFYIGSSDKYKESFRICSYLESIYKCIVEMKKNNVQDISIEEQKDKCLIKSLDKNHAFTFTINDWDKYSTKSFIKDNAYDFKFLDNIGLKQKSQ